MAQRDNLAYDYRDAYYGGYRGQNAVPAHSPNVRIKERPKAKPKAQTKQIVKKKTKTKAKAKISTIFMIAFLAAAAFLVLFRGVMITEKCNQIEKKEKELTDTVAVNQKMQLEIDQSLDLKKVESVATEKLGMRRPEKYQTVYVNLEQVDYVEKTSGHAAGGINILGLFNTIKEYLD